MGMSQKEQNDLVAENAAFKARIAALEAAKPAQGALACKVSEKGACSVYGLQRFPITLYAEQWERLAKDLPNIMAFILANKSTLSRKPARAQVVAQPTQSPETAAALGVADRVLGPVA